MGTGPEREGVREAIRTLLQADHGKGALGDLPHYKGLFPGYWDLVAEEYGALSAGTAGAGRTATSAGPSDTRPGAAAAPASPESPAERIGPYRVLKEIGRGGMGVVYLAEDTRIGRRVALKVLSPQFASSLHLQARFQREAELASKLDHPHICTVYEAGESDGSPYMAMRFVEGRPLSELVAESRERRRKSGVVTVPPGGAQPEGAETASAEGKRDLDRVLELMEKAARALHAAHEKGLIHRDIKPHNIMVTAEGEPVLLDFGLAREEAGEGHQLTQTGSLMGTPAYMSPEQLMAARVKLDRRTDVYSLGVTLYECLTLRLPFEAETVDRLYQKILATDPEDPRKVNRALPGDIKVVLDKVLEKDRERRYATALDLAEDLRRIRQWEPILARPPGLGYRLSRAFRRQRAVVAAVGLSALLAFGVSWFFSPGGLSAEAAQSQAMARDLRAQGQIAAARILCEKATEGWKEAEPATVPASVRILFLDLAEYRVDEAAALRRQGMFGESFALLLKAGEALAWGPSGWEVREDLALSRRIQDAGQRLRTEKTWLECVRAHRGRDTTRIVGLVGGLSGWGLAEFLDPLVETLKDPAHPEHEVATTVLSMSLSRGGGTEWLAKHEEVGARVLPLVLRSLASLGEEDFAREAGVVSGMVRRRCYQSPREVERELVGILEGGSLAAREARLAGDLLAMAADLPPLLSGDSAESEAVLAKEVRGLDRSEDLRRKLEVAARGLPAPGSPRDLWLREHTGRESPPEGWTGWWSAHREADPARLLGGALGLEGEPSSWTVDHLHRRFLAASPQRRASFHHLLALSVPPGTEPPLWLLDPKSPGGREPYEGIWRAWTEALKGRMTAAEYPLRVVRLLRGSWEEEPRVAVSEVVPISPWKEVTLPLQADVSVPGGTVGFTDWDWFKFHAWPSKWRRRTSAPAWTGGVNLEVRLELRPEGPLLVSRGVRFPGGVPLVFHDVHWSSQALETGPTCRIDDILVATLLSTPGEGREDGLEHCQDAATRALEALPAAISEVRAIPAGSREDKWEAVKELYSRFEAVRVLQVRPHAGARGALRRLQEGIPELKEALGGEWTHQGCEVEVSLTRLLAEDAEVLPEFSRYQTTGYRILNQWWTRDATRWREILLRSALYAKAPAFRGASVTALGSLVKEWPRLDPGALSLIEAARDRGPVPPEIGAMGDRNRRRGWMEFLGFLGIVLFLLVLLGAVLLLLRPFAPLESRMRPACLLVGGGILLLLVEIVILGTQVPTFEAGVGMVFLGTWTLALGGSGWIRLVTPVFWTVAGTALLVMAEYRAEDLASMVSLIHLFLLPTLGAGLAAAADMRRPTRPTESPLRWSAAWYRANIHAVQMAILIPVCAVWFLLAESYYEVGAFEGGPLMLALTWGLWVWIEVYRAAGRRSGSPSVLARAWRRVRRERSPAPAPASSA